MGSNEKKEKFKIGDDYYIPHLKLFRNDSDARIYFKIDKERKKFILGKIGRHAKQLNFVVELLKSQEITRTIRASLGNRAKEDLILEFIYISDLDSFKDKTEIFEQFFLFARKEQQKEVNDLIASEELNVENARRYIQRSLKHEYASENGTELNEALPKISPLNPKYRTKKHDVFRKISDLVEKFKGIGGEI